MSIDELWSEHMGRRFPRGTRGRDVDGIDFVMLDADIAGCVTTFLDRGSLDEWRESVLAKCIDEIALILPALSDEAREYFENLSAIGQAVLAEQHEVG